MKNPKTGTFSRDKLTLHLLREELKSRKLAMVLREIGLNESQLLVELNEPIAQLLELKSDRDFLEYDHIMDAHACRLANDPCSMREQITAVSIKLGLI